MLKVDLSTQHRCFSNLDHSLRVGKLHGFVLFIVSQLLLSPEKSNISGVAHHPARTNPRHGGVVGQQAIQLHITAYPCAVRKARGFGGGLGSRPRARHNF